MLDVVPCLLVSLHLVDCGLLETIYAAYHPGRGISGHVSVLYGQIRLSSCHEGRSKGWVSLFCARNEVCSLCWEVWKLQVFARWPSTLGEIKISSLRYWNLGMIRNWLRVPGILFCRCCPQCTTTHTGQPKNQASKLIRLRASSHVSMQRMHSKQRWHTEIQTCTYACSYTYPNVSTVDKLRFETGGRCR